jgi:hypothetical protein
MPKQRVKFTFPQELITLPIIYELGKQFQLVTNVRRADVTEDRGWVVLELEGDMEEIERGAGLGLRQGRPRRPRPGRHRGGMKSLVAPKQRPVDVGEAFRPPATPLKADDPGSGDWRLWNTASVP